MEIRIQQSTLNSLWYICRGQAVDNNVEYLWEDGKWRKVACQFAYMGGYYKTEEEARAHAEICTGQQAARAHAEICAGQQAMMQGG